MGSWLYKMQNSCSPLQKYPLSFILSSLFKISKTLVFWSVSMHALIITSYKSKNWNTYFKKKAMIGGHSKTLLVLWRNIYLKTNKTIKLAFLSTKNSHYLILYYCHDFKTGKWTTIFYALMCGKLSVFSISLHNYLNFNKNFVIFTNKNICDEKALQNL